MQKRKVHFTDGEGPIVFKDLAADITGKITFNGVSGDRFFQVVSLYDDYLAEVGTEGYQAGDTLALIAPSFLAHGIKDEDILEEAKDAKVCFGVEDLISGLQRDKWDIRIISTAYSQLWELVGRYLGIPMSHIACTNLDLKSLKEKFGGENFYKTILKAESEIISLMPLSEKALAKVDSGEPVEKVFEEDQIAPLTKTLDSFYWKKLPEIGYRVLDEVRVMGGKRKVEAAKEFVRELGVSLPEISYIGDSITDGELHRCLLKEGGLPIGLNGNLYALRDARVGIATTDMRKVRPVLDAWNQGGIEAVQKFIKEFNEVSFSPRKESVPSREFDPAVRYHIVDTINPDYFKEIVSIHKEFRTKVRGLAASRLG